MSWYNRDVILGRDETVGGATHLDLCWRADGILKSRELPSVKIKCVGVPLAWVCGGDLEDGGRGDEGAAVGHDEVSDEAGWTR